MENLKAAAFAANLTEEEKRQVAALSKALDTHKTLSNVPQNVANKVYSNLPESQRQSLVTTFGQENPIAKPNRGWLGTAWHYTSGTLADAGSKLMAGLQNVSDVTTRLYRTAAIGATQGMNLADAWEEANDKGDKVFNPGRIEDAKTKFGNTAVSVAMRIAAGEDPEKILASANPDEQKYVRLAYKKAGTQAEQDLFQDTLDAVQASKYSPGRQVANLILPKFLEGSGLAYKLVSGAVDAAYRVFADPLIIGGKVSNAYKVSKYSVDVLYGNFAKGGQKLQDYFASPAGKSFWDNYGAQLERYKTARVNKDAEEMRVANAELRRLAPEFGPAVVEDFLKADQPVTNALTAQAYFENADNALKMIKGGIGRKRVIMPRLAENIGGINSKFIPGTRAFRVALYTTANKVFDIDKMGPKYVEATFFGDATTTDGIKNAIIDGKKTTIGNVTATDNPKQVARPSMAMIMKRIDRAKAKFAIAPLFKDDMLDVTASDAPEQIYRLARIVMTKRDSQLIQQTFASVDDVGQRKEIFYGLWSTIADIRGLNATQPGQLIVRRLTGKGKSQFSVSRYGDEYADIGVLPSDYNNFVSAPNLVDLDRASTRSTLIQKFAGQANKDWVDRMTGYWSFLTLAGPRYAIRNATEDLMVNLAIGGSTPWGIAKNRYLSTRVNTALQTRKGLTKTEKFVEDPLGLVMRLVNKKEADKWGAEIAGLDTKIVKIREEIKSLADQMDTLDDAGKALNRAKIADLRQQTEGGVVQQTRVILAKALTSGRINKLRERLNLKPMFQDEIDELTEQIIFGDLDNTLSTIAEGGFNFATGGDVVTRTLNFTKATGVRSAALEIDAPAYARAQGSIGFSPKAIDPTDESSLVTYLMRIGYFANDELGAIAVANLDQDNVVQMVFEWIKKNPDFVSLSRLDAKGVDMQQHAQLVVNRARELFEKRPKVEGGSREINTDLLNKIRSRDPETGNYVISGKLSLDDLPDNSFDFPESVVGPELVPISDTNNYATSLVTNGWTWLGMANARLSRQPIVFNEMVKIRKQMKKSGFYDAFIESRVKYVDPTDSAKVAEATRNAKLDLATAVEERAVAQVLQYVDNPLIRSQIAFSARNFARFYRATEDFYRRLYRAVRYNPESIVKVGLTYEGITHSGWVQKDDQGEPYFVYPGIEPVYRAVQGAMQLLGVDAEFKTPLPIQFGAQLKMVTPSANPDSLIPTFAGPLAGVSVKTLTNIVDIWNPGAADTITRFTLGKYAVDQPMLSAFLPAHINRLYGAMSKDERDGQYASAWRKAVTYLEAGGHGIPKRYDENNNLIPPSAQELEDYRLRVKNTTLSILGTRFVFGFFAPASPQVQLKSDMAEWVRDNGRANFKQVWNKLLDQYPGDYNAAMAKWVELFPDQIPFTIPESERSTVAYFRYAEESGAFVESNADLFKKYPQGAAFLIPHKAGFSWDAYKTMTDMGLRRNKRVADYLREVQTAADLQTYYAKRADYEDKLTTVGTDFERSQLRQEFTDWKTLFFAGRPLVQEELSQGSQKAIERLKAIDDLRAMLYDKNVTAAPKTRSALKDMLDLYDKYKNNRKSLDQVSGAAELVKMMKDDTLRKMRELSEVNENTKSAYNVLFGSLLGD